jgi:UDP-glucose 4-epimerase
MLLGFNPRIQVLHPDDAAAAFALAALGTTCGAVNVAAPDTLPLAQAIRLSGNRPAPLPGMLLNAADLPFERSFLRYSCVADTRHAHRALNWKPMYSAQAALRAMVAEPAQRHTTRGTAALSWLQQQHG